MIVLGLTGSIGMGKSTAAALLQNLGVPVHDSDEASRHVTARDGAAYPHITAAFPYFEYPDIYIGKDKIIDRQKLGALVFSRPDLRKILEHIVHPFVQQAQQDFLRIQRKCGRDIAALDIPLLYETGADTRVDYVLNCSAPANVQRARVLARPGMSAEKFEAILASQMEDGEKCARADFVIKTGLNRADTMKQLKIVLEDIRNQTRNEKKQEKHNA